MKSLATVIPIVFSGRTEIKLALTNFTQPSIGTGWSRSASNQAFVLGLLDEPYGCWCRFDTVQGWSIGKGHPVDLIDLACRNLNGGYHCLREDYPEPGCQVYGGDLNTGTPLYRLPTIWTLEKFDEIEPACKLENPGEDDCLIDLCIVETRFVMEVIENRGTLDTDSMLLSNGFSVENTCVGTAEGKTNTFECCGIYPTKLPFKATVDGDRVRDCCGERTYNVDFSCCANEATSEVISQTLGTC